MDLRDDKYQSYGKGTWRLMKEIMKARQRILLTTWCMREVRK